MTYTHVRLDVADFSKWRAGFDAYAAARQGYGATGNNQIFRDHDNPNTVTIILEWEDDKRAREWFSSPTLREAQQTSGIVKLHEWRVLDRA
jgi:heme-degrading monooxygenase HmoA